MGFHQAELIIIIYILQIRPVLIENKVSVISKSKLFFNQL